MSEDGYDLTKVKARIYLTVQLPIMVSVFLQGLFTNRNFHGFTDNGKR